MWGRMTKVPRPQVRQALEGLPTLGAGERPRELILAAPDPWAAGTFARWARSGAPVRLGSDCHFRKVATEYDK